MFQTLKAKAFSFFREHSSTFFDIVKQKGVQTEILSKEGNDLCFSIIGIIYDNVKNHSNAPNVTINITLLWHFSTLT